MRNLPLKYYPKVITRWLELAFTFRKVIFLDLESDQDLIYSGNSCSLICTTKSALLLKVYHNGKQTGTYYPGEFPVIHLLNQNSLFIKAIGVYNSAGKNMILNARPMNYRMADRPELKIAVLPQPEMIQNLGLQLKYLHPATPVPVLGSFVVTLDTATTQIREAELDRAIMDQQTQSETQNFSLSYGDFVL